MFTEKGIELINKAKEIGLYEYYDEYAGNFGFTPIDFYTNIYKITQWLRENRTYVILFQDGYEDNICYWLTEEY